MLPERLLRDYFHAKDENRPHILEGVFAADARLEVESRSDQISFPSVTLGRDAIADLLVRRFNQTYENIYSFYLARPKPNDQTFACDWLVAMTEKATGSVRVGCGRYDWTFRKERPVRVRRLVIAIEAMLVLEPGAREEVWRWLSGLAYPWTSAAAVLRSLPVDILEPIGKYLGRERKQS